MIDKIREARLNHRIILIWKGPTRIIWIIEHCDVGKSKQMHLIRYQMQSNIF